MKKVGILGGTFDPVHNGHMLIARAAMEQYELCEVLLMTGGNPPHKRQTGVTPARLRHEMVKLAASGESGLIPFDYEVDKETYSYTYETMTELNEKYPDTEWYFIIGEDSLKDIVKWYKPEIIVKKCILLVYPRGGSDFNELIDKRRKELAADIRKIDAPLFGISSTEIRNRVRDCKSIRYYVPDAVNEYITENKLYKEQN